MERAEDQAYTSDKNTCKPAQPESGTLAGRQSQIAQALDRLDYAVDGAQEAFKTLDGRLGIILLPAMPEASDQANRTQPESGTHAGRQPPVPLAADIERYADRINGLVNQMHNLTERLGL